MIASLNTCDRCNCQLDPMAPKGDPKHKNSVCTDDTPGFKEFDWYCDTCYALPEVRGIEPIYNQELAWQVATGYGFCEDLPDNEPEIG